MSFLFGVPKQFHKNGKIKSVVFFVKGKQEGKSYEFNPDFLKSTYIQGLKVYVNAQNPVTWKNNSGFSPEAPGSPTRFGVDTGGYPVPAIYSLGLNATF